MKNIIRYPAKFYIVDLAICSLGLLISATGFVILLIAKNILWSLIYALIFVAMVVLFIFALRNMQWIVVDSTHIYAYNIFGLIKKLEISRIKTAVYINVSAWGLKGYTKRFPCIALSQRKSLAASEIKDAYNAKKHSYVVVPDSEEARQMLGRCQILNSPK